MLFVWSRKFQTPYLMQNLIIWTYDDIFIQFKFTCIASSNCLAAYQCNASSEINASSWENIFHWNSTNNTIKTLPDWVKLPLPFSSHNQGQIHPPRNSVMYHKTKFSKMKTDRIKHLQVGLLASPYFVGNFGISTQDFHSMLEIPHVYWWRSQTSWQINYCLSKRHYLT